MQEEKRRNVGIDLGKRTYELAIIGKDNRVTRSNGKTTMEGRKTLYEKLESTDKVAIEAGNLAFDIAKDIGKLGCNVNVLNPGKLAVIYASMKKTDKEDSLKLARLMQDNRSDNLPTVSVPTEKQMEQRELLAASRRVVQERTRHINVLHGLFLHQGITTIVKKNLATKESRETFVKMLTGFRAEEAAYELRELENIEKWSEELDAKIKAEWENDDEIKKLTTIPGVGPKVALAFVAYVDVSRFANAAQVSNHIGLVPKVDMSCSIVKYGGITKRGNSYLRALLVQGAWSTVRSKDGGALRERFEYMKGHNIPKRKTIVGIARRLAGLMYTILRDGTKYEARKFITPEQRVEKLAEAAVA